MRTFLALSAFCTIAVLILSACAAASWPSTPAQALTPTAPPAHPTAVQPASPPASPVAPATEPAGVGDLAYDCKPMEPVQRPQKTPLPSDGLAPSLSGPFQGLPFDESRVIGFTFLQFAGMLVAAPLKEACSFRDPQLGQILGVVWMVDSANVATPTVVSLAEQGPIAWMMTGPDFRQPQQTEVVQEDALEPTQSASTAARITASIQSSAPGAADGTGDIGEWKNTVCFRLDSTRYCVAPDQFNLIKSAPGETRELVSRMGKASAVLEDRKVLSGSVVLIDNTIAEIEGRELTERCHPGVGTDRDNCKANVMVAAILPGTEKIDPDITVTTGVGVVVQPFLAKDYYFSPGYYALRTRFANSGPPIVTGVGVTTTQDFTPSDEVIEVPVPAAQAPYIGRVAPSVAVENPCIWDGRVCIWWETAQ